MTLVEMIQKRRNLLSATATAATAATASNGNPPIIEPAVKSDGNPLTPVYWERADGSIYGPASVEFFCRLGNSDGLIVNYEGELLWVSSERLRLKRQWEKRRPIVSVDQLIPKGMSEKHPFTRPQRPPGS